MYLKNNLDKFFIHQTTPIPSNHMIADAPLDYIPLARKANDDFVTPQFRAQLARLLPIVFIYWTIPHRLRLGARSTILAVSKEKYIYISGYFANLRREAEKYISTQTQTPQRANVFATCDLARFLYVHSRMSFAFVYMTRSVFSDRVNQNIHSANLQCSPMFSSLNSQNPYDSHKYIYI